MTNDDRPYVGDVKDVRLVATLKRPGLYNRIWQPFIEIWRPAHLLVAYGLHLTGKVDMGDIVCAISTDDGNTWEEPVTIFDHRVALGTLRVAYANPVLYHPLGQDVVWCYAMRCPLYYRDSEDSQLCAAYSADGGRSWQPVELAVHYHSPLITCAGVLAVPREDGARYLLPVHRNTLRHDPLGSQDQLVLESTNLLEWKLAGYVPHPAAGRVFMHEGNVAPGDTPSELKIVMRTATYGRDAKALEPPNAYSSVSADGGRAWSPGRPEPALYNAVSKAYFGQDARGNHIYVYSTGPAGQRRAFGYKIRAPSGSWSDERPFYDAGVRNSYPTLLERAPGRFYAVWDSSDSPDVPRTAIRFGRFDIG
ncbi:MAG: glycoside hydrolase [Anaerolineae bacterium]|jgi:hypothetical protein|nr:glycoside hydrolase [Anaerolineae bacterium]